MSEYYAVHLTVSQGKFDTKACAGLVYSDQFHDTILQLEWPDMPPQSSPENAGEWLFRVLEELVTNFDSHQVRNAERKPIQGRQEI